MQVEEQLVLQFSHATDNITLFLRGVCNYFSMINNSLFLVLAKIYNYTGRMQYNNAIQNVFFYKSSYVTVITQVSCCPL